MNTPVYLFTVLLFELFMVLMQASSVRNTYAGWRDIVKADDVPEAPPVPEEKAAIEPNVRKCSHLNTGSLIVNALSIQGRGHLQNGTPCQDCHHIETLDEGLFLAVVSDGAGSKENAETGSQIVCEKCAEHLKDALKRLGWDSLVCSWDGVFRKVVELIQLDLAAFAKNNEGISFDSLAATLMVLVIGPGKSLFGHVGDGRAGILTDDGWRAILTPHKGAEANQTVFVTNDVLAPGLTLSGVPVPETMIIDNPVSAFAMMTDGCENGLWMTSRKEDLPDGDFRYIPLNHPFVPALDDILGRLSGCQDEEESAELLHRIVTRYNRPLQNEHDDKTLCIGFTPIKEKDNKE